MGTALRKTSHTITIPQSETVALVRYDAACKALAAAKCVDEAKEIRDVSMALRVYAKQAKNRQLEIDAVEIRARAERRVGELITAQKNTVGLNTGAKGIGKSVVPNGNRTLPTLADAGIDKKLSARAQELATLPAVEFEIQVEDWRERVQEPSARITRNIHFSSETPEHYTPSAIVEAVIACLGAIDLDPCSNTGSPNVPAATHYTSAENGLTRAWCGRVYMNPPYGREIDDWVTKLCAEHIRPDGVDEAIALLPARTDTQWFLKLRDFVCCFVEGRLTFIGNKDPAPFPSVVVYLGEDIGKFYHHFSPFGDVWRRLKRDGILESECIDAHSRRPHLSSSAPCGTWARFWMPPRPVWKRLHAEPHEPWPVLGCVRPRVTRRPTVLKSSPRSWKRLPRLWIRGRHHPRGKKGDGNGRSHRLGPLD